MLKFLLDEQISPAVADGLRRRSKRTLVYCLPEREGGRFLASTDELLLREAARQELTLVTYDRKTIPPILKVWAQAARAHAGVVFVDPETIPPSDFGGLIRALQRLWQQTNDWDWTDRIITLRL